ncbi:hypothetical protein V6N12_068498 [Hibiscus sabdariffa]|uniref:NAB domain-containing protein n=1 Tax=Hibiscus sabdariffa TaxID=183260 RepID=A0ABR2FQB2_9ROSI
MEKVNVSKTDADTKVEKILKLVKRRNRGKKETELVGLVEEFHKQYQSLYAQYDHLKRGQGKEALKGKVNESCSNHATNSDSEYYSSEDVDNRHSCRKRSIDMDDELRKAHKQVADLEHQLASSTKEKEALDLYHRDALCTIQQLETMNGDLRNEVEETEKRLFALGTEHNGRVAGLEEQLVGLKTELESQHNQRRELEAQLNGMTAELIKARETKKEEIAKLDESFDQIKPMKEELDSIRSHNNELEILVQSKSKEISQYLVQVKTLKEELARKSAAEQIMVEEKQGLQVQVMDLESEVDALRKEKNKSEDEVKSSILEISHLREEKGKLNARILELETLFRNTGSAYSALQEDCISKRANETAAQMKVEVDRLQPKLDSMKLQNADPQRTTQVKDQSINRSMPPKTKLVRRLSLGNNFNFHCLERKMEDLAIEFRKKVDDSIRLLYQRVKVVERIQYENTELYTSKKRGLEQEIEALKQEVATIEAEYDALRQELVMLDAGNEALKQEVDMLEAGNEALKQEVVTLEAALKKLRGIMESEKNTTIGLNSMVDKLEDERNFLTPISIVTDEECENRVEEAKSNVDVLVAEMQKENEEELLRERVMNLEAKLSEEGEEKLKVLKAMKEVEEKMREMQKENEKLLREEVMFLEARLRAEGEEKLKVLKAMCEVEEKMREMQRENEKLLREKVMNFEAKLSEEEEEKLKVLKAMSKVKEKMREMQKENEKVLMEEVMKFEAKLSEVKEEKWMVLKAMSELQNRVRELEKINREKDETLLAREEEKREAIRQLCLLIDYHRTCCDHLKQSISTLTVRLKINNKT